MRKAANMGSLSLSLLAVLICALAAVANGELRRDVRYSMMPRVPTVAEQRRDREAARSHPNRLHRLPPAYGRAPFLRKLSPEERAAIMQERRAQAEQIELAGEQRTRDKKVGREPQPDIAGRVLVAPNNGSNIDPFITNGEKAVLGQFPWQAGILQYYGGYQAWCGGSVISSVWILTAGHCVDDGATEYTISVGSLKSSGGKESTLQTIIATLAIQHPEYSPYFIDNDVALISLPSKIVFSAYVAPAKLPSYSMATDMMVGTVATVSGWGLTTDYDDWITDDLMFIHNTIDDGSACYDTYGNAWIPNKICTQTPDRKSICSGDSGGALVFEEKPGTWTQIGIVSFGSSGGCVAKYPTAFTRVASFLEFIEDTTNIAIRE